MKNEDKLFNHVKIAYIPIKCSDCHKIIWLDSYIIGEIPYEKTKRLCKSCTKNYTLNEYNGKYFLERMINRGNCMICGKELTEGLFFCKECTDKVREEIDNNDNH